MSERVGPNPMSVAARLPKPGRRTEAAVHASRDVRSGVPFRLFLTFSATDDVVALVLQQLEAWVREKHNIDVSLRAPGLYEVKHGAFMVAHRPESSEGAAFRFRHRHEVRGDVWRTSVAVALSPQGTGWIRVETSSDTGRTPGTPRFVTDLLGVLDLFDGDYQMVPGVRLVANEEGVEELLEAVCSETRHGLLFIAATDEDPDQDHRKFRDRLARWTKPVPGRAQAVLLTPASSKLFNAAMGTSHDVPAWGVRTYGVGVDPAVAVDGRRHRILTPARIRSESDAVIQKIFTGVAERHAFMQRVPREAQSVLRALTRIEDGIFVHALEDTTPSVSRVESPEAAKNPAHNEPDGDPVLHHAVDTSVAEEADDYLSLVAALREGLDLDGIPTAASVRGAIERLRTRVEAETLAQAEIAAREAADRRTLKVEERLARRQQELEALEDAVAEAHDAVEDMYTEVAIAEHERLRAEDEVRWLRGRLRAMGAYVEAAQAMPVEASLEPPGSPSELVDKIDELNEHGVFFSGDRSAAAELDDRDTLGTIAQVGWECVLTLVDYARAKRDDTFSGGLKQYLQHPPDGDYRVTTVTRLGEKESQGDMAMYGHLRVFPLPEGVARDGQREVEMQMHWKLPKCGIVTPRMHFLDNTGVDGCVYIGYLGRHLRSRLTN